MLRPNMPIAPLGESGGGGGLVEKLRELHNARSEGLISDAEFENAKRAALMSVTTVLPVEPELLPVEPELLPVELEPAVPDITGTYNGPEGLAYIVTAGATTAVVGVRILRRGRDISQHGPREMLYQGGMTWEGVLPRHVHRGAKLYWTFDAPGFQAFTSTAHTKKPRRFVKHVAPLASQHMARGLGGARKCAREGCPFAVHTRQGHGYCCNRCAAGRLVFTPIYPCFICAVLSGCDTHGPACERIITIE